MYEFMKLQILFLTHSHEWWWEMLKNKKFFVYICILGRDNRELWGYKYSYNEAYNTEYVFFCVISQLYQILMIATDYVRQ